MDHNTAKKQQKAFVDTYNVSHHLEGHEKYNEKVILAKPFSEYNEENRRGKNQTWFWLLRRTLGYI